MKYFCLFLLLSSCATAPTIAEVRESQSNRTPAAAVRGFMARCDMGVYNATSVDTNSGEFSGTAIEQKSQDFGSYFEKFNLSLDSKLFTLSKESYSGEYKATIRLSEKSFVSSVFLTLPARILVADTESNIYAEMICYKN